MSEHPESDDFEQQPLHSRVTENYGATVARPRSAASKRPSKPIWNYILAISIALACLGAIGIYASRFVPSPGAIQTYYENVTKIQIHGISYEGWDSKPGNPNIEPSFSSVSHGDENTYKYLKLRAKMSVSFDHDQALPSTSNSTSARQENSLIRFFSQSVVKTLCFDLNDMQAYNDNATGTQSLGSVHIPQAVCVDLRANTTTELDIPIVIHPNAQNIASVIIKIWKRKFHELNLWSSLDVSLSKWGLSLGSVQIPKLEWNDFLDWNHVQSYIDQMHQVLRDPIKVNDLQINDSDEAVKVQVGISYDCPGFLKGFLESQKGFSIPPTSWTVRMPGCRANEPVALQNAVFETPSVPVDLLLAKTSPNINITGQIYGPLPDELLYQVCDSDEKNVVTPINLFLKKVFSATESVDFQICGLHSGETSTSFIPKCLLDQILPSIVQEVKANLTIDSDQLVEQVTVDGLKLKWSQRGWDDKRLEVMGKVNTLVNLPFYNATLSKEEETVSIKKIKGLTKLFHNDIHFVSVPMDVWLNAKSEILRSADPAYIQLQVSFDISGQDVVVVDRLELTRCLNEILVRGQATVYVEGQLDLMMETRLGSFVLLGLEGDGTTIIKK
ncbi:LAFA_0G13850g1_1 [Lachancea sp. 'fantastica']|nr:LAFA_0G13850g1_1 [Lachancea sp. 'fantastica']